MLNTASLFRIGMCKHKVLLHLYCGGSLTSSQYKKLLNLINLNEIMVSSHIIAGKDR